MKQLDQTSEAFSPSAAVTPVFADKAAPQSWKGITPKRLRGGTLLIIGYLLSPLCWWNDLVFNLPIAYGFGYLWSWISPHLMLPGLIAGYWLSNIIGILLVQMGAIDVWQGQPKQRHLKQELLTGLLASTAYTLIVVVLFQFKLLDLPFLPNNWLSSILPIGITGCGGF